MKATDVIWTKKADLLVSAAYVQELIKHNNSAFGGALVDGGVMDMTKQDTAPQLDQFEQIQTQYKNLDMVFWACTTEKPIMEDDVQPFVALEKTDGNPACLVFMAGDFSKFTEKDSNHTDAWLAYQKRVLPKLQKEFKSSGGDKDYSKFVEALNDPVWRDDMKEVWVKHGTITIVHHTGEIVSYMDEDDYMEFPWGSTSNDYDYTEAVAATPKEEVKPKSGLTGFRRKVAAALTPAVVEKPVVAEAKPKTEDPPTPKAKVVKEGDVPGRVVHCPANINGKKEIRAYYERHLPTGVAPNGYRQKPRIWVPESEYGKDGAVAPAAAATVADDNASERTGFRSRAKAQENAVASVTPITPKIQTGEDYLPVLNSKHKQELHDFLAKAGPPKAFVDNNGEIPSQETLDNIEQELPNFAEQSGTLKSVRDTFSWNYRFLVNMGYSSAEGLALLALNYRALMFQNMKQNGTIPKASKDEDNLNREADTVKTGFKRKKVA